MVGGEWRVESGGWGDWWAVSWWVESSGWRVVGGGWEVVHSATQIS